MAGKTREVEQLTALLSSSKQQVESLEHDLGSRDSALRLANLKLKETESMQNGVRDLYTDKGTEWLYHFLRN